MTDIVLIHGLTFDHRHWDGVRELLPNHDVRAFDLPGHGAEPARDSYGPEETIDWLREKIGDTRPVLVGHSIGAIFATIYAARYPVKAVVNVDQPLTLGGFGDAVRDAEPLLRSPRWREFWDRIEVQLGVGKLPPELRGTPRQDLLLGYWSELLATPPAEVDAQRHKELETIQSQNIPYVFVEGTPGNHFPHVTDPGMVAARLEQVAQSVQP